MQHRRLSRKQLLRRLRKLSRKQPLKLLPKTGKKTEYPLTISNFNYEKESVEETFEKAPERVITFWSNSLESMLALGLGDRVISAVGMDENSILPELKDEFDKMIAGKEFNDFTDSNAAMSKEAAIMLEPDFILGWKSSFSDKTIGDVDYWHENGVNTYIALNSNDISEYRTVENEYTDILTLGEIFDVQDKAEEIVNEIKDEVARVKAAVCRPGAAEGRCRRIHEGFHLEL